MKYGELGRKSDASVELGSKNGTSGARIRQGRTHARRQVYKAGRQILTGNWRIEDHIMPDGRAYRPDGMTIGPNGRAPVPDGMDSLGRSLESTSTGRTAQIHARRHGGGIWAIFISFDEISLSFLTLFN